MEDQNPTKNDPQRAPDPNSDVEVLDVEVSAADRRRQFQQLAYNYATLYTCIGETAFQEMLKTLPSSERNYFKTVNHTKRSKKEMKEWLHHFTHDHRSARFIADKYGKSVEDILMGIATIVLGKQKCLNGRSLESLVKECMPAHAEAGAHWFLTGPRRLKYRPVEFMRTTGTKPGSAALLCAFLLLERNGTEKYEWSFVVNRSLPRENTVKAVRNDDEDYVQDTTDLPVANPESS